MIIDDPIRHRYGSTRSTAAAAAAVALGVIEFLKSVQGAWYLVRPAATAQRERASISELDHASLSVYHLLTEHIIWEYKVLQYYPWYMIRYCIIRTTAVCIYTAAVAVYVSRFRPTFMIRHTKYYIHILRLHQTYTYSKEGYNCTLHIPMQRCGHLHNCSVFLLCDSSIHTRDVYSSIMIYYDSGTFLFLHASHSDARCSA